MEAECIWTLDALMILQWISVYQNLIMFWPALN
jgi:hypothetical protein